MNKNKLLELAEVIDGLRIFPRGILVGYAILLAVVSLWFMGLPAPTGTQAAFVSTVVGIAGLITGFYNNTGRSWTKKPPGDD